MPTLRVAVIISQPTELTYESNADYGIYELDEKLKTIRSGRSFNKGSGKITFAPGVYGAMLDDGAGKTPLRFKANQSLQVVTAGGKNPWPIPPPPKLSRYANATDYAWGLAWRPEPTQAIAATPQELRMFMYAGNAGEAVEGVQDGRPTPEPTSVAAEGLAAEGVQRSWTSFEFELS